MENINEIKDAFIREYNKKYNLMEGTNRIPFVPKSIVIDKAAYDLIKMLQKVVAGEELELSNFQKSILMFTSQEEYDKITRELEKLGVDYEKITNDSGLEQTPTADDELDPLDNQSVSPFSKSGNRDGIVDSFF